MAGIMAALEAHDDIRLLRQPVDDLALPLVAPLGADDDNIGHFAGVPYNSSGFSMILPSRNHGRGRSHARQPHRIKEAALRSKQEGSLIASGRRLQPIDIPGKFVAA